MILWASRHPIFTWSIAWGVTGIGLQVADVFSEPRRGPLWFAIVAGLLAWGVAGAATLHDRRMRIGTVIWAGAYLAAFWLGAVLGDWFEHNDIGPLSSAGFVGMLFGWAVGAAAGALVSAYLLASPRSSLRPALFAVVWGGGFFVAGYVGLVAAMIFAQAAKGMLGFLGNQQIALMIGWGFGCALGGAFASAAGMTARRIILGSRGNIFTRSTRVFCGLLVLAGIGSALLARPAPETTLPDGEHRHSPGRSFGRLPLYFIENQGQIDSQVSHYIQGRDKIVYFTRRGVTYALADPETGRSKHWAVRLEFLGANQDVRPEGRDRTPATISYFRGGGTASQTGLRTYSDLRYQNLWSGIHLVFSGIEDRLKYSFIVEPGADPSQIRLAYRGAQVRLNESGQLEVRTPVGGFQDEKPHTYQESDGVRTPVDASFVLDARVVDDGVSYGFHLGDYDPSRPLVIDPAVVVYAGYIGGSDEDEGNDVAVDTAGNVYVVGNTASSELTFPVLAGPGQSFQPGGTCIFGLPCGDAFVAKLNPAGELVYAGYIGGAGGDGGAAIAVDSEGSAYITGLTNSSEATFPVTVGPDLTFNGDPSLIDAFVAKLDPSGTSLVFAGYIGGVLSDNGSDIAVDSAGNAYIVGNANSPESSFPATVGPDLTHNSFTPNNRSTDAFIAKVRADGTGLVYAGFIGGESGDVGGGVAVDSEGNAYVTGTTFSRESSFPVSIGPDLTFNDEPEAMNGDAFVVKVNPAGTGFVYGGYIGGSSTDSAGKIAVDRFGNAYVYGLTSSSETSFPVRVGPDVTFNVGEECSSFPFGVPCTDAFIAKVEADGTGLVYAGYIGGTDAESSGLAVFPPGSIAVDAAGNAYITGVTFSNESSFPALDGPDLTFTAATCGSFPFQGPCSEGFVAKVKADGTGLDFAGYIGGSGQDRGEGIAVDGFGDVYVTGATSSDPFIEPVSGGPDATFNGATDAFVVKIESTAAQPVVNAASFQGGPVAPGEIVSVFGSQIGPEVPADAVLDASGKLATMVSDTEVRFDGTAGPLFHVSEGQINVQVPYGIEGQTQVEVEVIYQGEVRQRITVPAAASAPGLFTLSGGAGQVIAVHKDGSLNSPENPAASGDVVLLYATGEGQTSPSSKEGVLAPEAEPLPRPVQPVELSIGGQAAEVLYAGAAPRFAGLMQINVRIPPGASPGDAVPVILRVGELASQARVTLVLR